MTTVRVQVNIRGGSPDPSDVVCNVWHFDHAGEFAVEHANKIGVPLQAFYNSLGTYMSGSVMNTPLNGWNMTFATLNKGSAGAEDDTASEVLFTRSWTPTGAPAGGTSPLPDEVAICLSVRGDTEGVAESSGGGTVRPAARRRGRLYLGPWSSNTIDVDASNYSSRVAGSIITLILNSYENLIEDIQDPALGGTATTIRHVVYSPTSSLVWPIRSAYVDNAFDIVRSRGQDATARTTRAITQDG